MGWYDRKVRRVRDLSCGDTRIYLELEVRRVDCRRCGTVKRERLDFLADGRPLSISRNTIAEFLDGGEVEIRPTGWSMQRRGTPVARAPVG